MSKVDYFRLFLHFFSFYLKEWKHKKHSKFFYNFFKNKTHSSLISFKCVLFSLFILIFQLPQQNASRLLCFIVWMNTPVLPSNLSVRMGMALIAIFQTHFWKWYSQRRSSSYLYTLLIFYSILNSFTTIILLYLHFNSYTQRKELQ